MAVVTRGCEVGEEDVALWGERSERALLRERRILFEQVLSGGHPAHPSTSDSSAIQTTKAAFEQRAGSVDRRRLYNITPWAELGLGAPGREAELGLGVPRVGPGSRSVFSGD